MSDKKLLSSLDLNGQLTEEIKKGSQKEEYFNYLQLTPSVYVYHFEYDCQANEVQVFKRPGENTYIFAINIQTALDFSCHSRKYTASKYDVLMLYGDLPAVEIEMVGGRRYEFIAIGIEEDTLKTLLKNSQNKSYIEFLSFEKLFYKMPANLKIIDRIYRIYNQAPQPAIGIDGIGHLYLWIYLVVDQYLQDLTTTDTIKYSLEKWEIDEIRKTAGEIRQNPGQQYKVTDIHKKTGVSIPRLQRGFKGMYGMTIALFVREMRLQMAERLIREADHNITEIVYSIGLSSRSYFSRIFKERYAISPIDYKQKLKKENT